MSPVSIVVHETVVTLESIGPLSSIRSIARSSPIVVHDTVAMLDSIGSLTPGPAAVLVGSHADWSRSDHSPESGSSQGALLTGGAETTPPPCEALLTGGAETTPPPCEALLTGGATTTPPPCEALLTGGATTTPPNPPFARGGKECGDGVCSSAFPTSDSGGSPSSFSLSRRTLANASTDLRRARWKLR